MDFLDFLLCVGTLGWIRFGEAGDVIENSPYDLRMGQKLMDGRFSGSFLAQKFWILKAEEAQITGSVVHRNSTLAGFNFGGQTFLR